jgi:DNA primase
MPTASIFEKLREEVDLTQLAGCYTELRPSGRASVGCCPHPNHGDQSPSFHVYADKRFYCFGCGWHGDVVDLWASIKGLEPGLDAALGLSREHGVSVPEMGVEAREEAENRRKLEAECLELAKEHHEALSSHARATEWWEKRGFDKAMRGSFLLGVAGDGTEATIPFFHRGRVQGIIRRRIEGEPKYLLPPREEFPGGYRPLFIPGPVKGETFVVEGYVDALVLAALGYGAVAVGGTHANDEQMEELKRLPAPLYILPDADEEGQKAARGWVWELYPEALLCPAEYETEAKDD